MTELSPMSRVIRHTKTGKYFKRDGWTDDPREAYCFPSIEKAMKACEDFGLKDTELVLCFGDRRFDVRVRICEQSAS